MFRKRNRKEENDMDELNKVLENIKQREIDMGIKITTLHADRDNIRTELKDCVNELCLKCGNYHESYLGACDGCRWKKVKEGFQ
jgi:hypothetical protein